MLHFAICIMVEEQAKGRRGRNVCGARSRGMQISQEALQETRERSSATNPESGGRELRICLKSTFTILIREQKKIFEAVTVLTCGVGLDDDVRPARLRVHGHKSTLVRGGEDGGVSAVVVVRPESGVKEVVLKERSSTILL